MAPIDVVSEEALGSVASSELVDKLTHITPSFNVQRLPLNDGLIYVRPATLRGLSPDHTLVLVNGKRRHRSALLGYRGAQGADLAQIPSFAVKRIEVLRDGASAQYGSDAIAGVINLILEDFVGFDSYVQGSQYAEGDGDEVQVGLRGGLDLADNGFLTGTLEYTDADPTSRSRQRPDAVDFQQANPDLNVPNPVQDWGQPERQALRFALNAQYALSDRTEFYGFGTYGEGEGSSDFNWRNPESTSAYRPSPTAFPDFDLHDIYPAGFSPQFSQEDEDLSTVAGLRGDINPQLSWDLSASYGRNDIEYYLDNTINGSLGPESPTSFYAGSLIQSEANLNLDFVYSWELAALAAPANVAFGAERREETYEIEAGDPASYAVGPGAVDGLPSGSNGFPGYSADQADEYDQESYAAYVDLEAPLTDRLTTGVALRYEDFSEFGDTTDGKLSLRYEFSEGFALRATASTGFRAPTPGQLGSTRTSQGLDTETLNLFTNGRLSPTDPIAQYFGAKALEAEESTSFTAGATFRTDSGFSGSLDVYQIEVDNRFGQSQTYTVTDDIRSELVAEGVPGAESITGVNFYTNAFDTRTRGVDLVASYSMPAGEGDLVLGMAWNYNDTEVTETDGTIGEIGIVRLEDGLPELTGNLSAQYRVHGWDIQGRLRYYGSWTDASGQPTGDIYQDFSEETFFDLSLSYQFDGGVRATFGAENLFDNYPDEATFQANRGLVYSRNSPYDTDGALYYMKLNYSY
ncbi:TonB-dependent receptor [Parahaliea mediterranea]|uniref:TonB-dependent receptor n=1 Tax=Parahaliea mediterranea TaxID=651086 RepID=A0A939IK97_9GAMM|nr:TonB-dependent receptor [Parahaliea mediterranea]MBN7798524.1 TonB-dependent receptor [Parahaliea mediterranea]